MIFDGIISFFAGMVGALLSLVPLPAAPSFSGFISGWDSIWTYVGWLNGYLPISEAVTMVGLMLAMWVVFHAYRAVVWAYHQIWGSD